MTLTTDTRDYLLAFADDEHFIGQQHTEWIGAAPFLEEDLAFASIGQDELGHAAMLYGFILESEGEVASDSAIDRLAYRRDASEYRCCGLVEFIADDWAIALVRQWLYDTVEELRWGLLMQSSLEGLAEIARQVSQDESFHRLHANALLDDLLTDENAKQRILIALKQIQPLTLELVAPIPGEIEALAAGIASGRLCDSIASIEATIAARFDVEMSLSSCLDLKDCRLGRSYYFAPLLQRMRYVLDSDPDAKW